MYRDWYVAYVNQISADDTASFLFLAEVLRNPASPVSLLRSSLDEVSNHLEFNLQIYFLPYLAKIAVNKEHVLQKKAKGIIRRISGNFPESVANEVARNIDEPNSVRVQIRKLGYANIDSHSLSEEDYITLTESINGIMCLSALMNYDKDMIHSITQEDLCDEFLKMALKGSFGRYSMVLAQETCLLSGSANLYDAAKASQENTRMFYEFPDTIEILLKFYFHGKSAQEILQLAFDPKTLLFDRFVGKCKENTEFWLSSGLPLSRAKNQYTKQLNILWENIAVYLAIQSAIDTQMLYPVINSIAGYWEKQREAYDYEMRDLAQSKKSRCPWMFRSSPVYTKSKSKPFTEYKWMEEQPVVLKSAMSAPILSLVFSYNKEKLPEFFYELVINLQDAYSGPGISQSIVEGCFLGHENAQEIYFSEALISLLAYAKRLINYVGKGCLDNSVPKQLFLIVEKYARRILNNEDASLSLQRKLLYSGPSVMACVSFSYEEASGEFPEVKEGDYWMKGGEESYARKICEIALNDFWRYIRNSKLYKSSPEAYITRPIELAYEHFPDLIEKADIFVEDWLHKDIKLPKNTQVMLLRSYRADDWKVSGERKKEISLGDYPMKDKQYSIALAAIMHRINAILEKDFINKEEREILKEWLHALNKMDSPKSFSRSSRFLATEVLKRLLWEDTISQLNHGEMEQNEIDAADIIQIVVETVADLSKGAPFYQYAVAKVIIESKYSEELSGFHDKVKCIFFNILLSQDKETDTGNIILTDPYKINQQVMSRDIRRQIILWYIGNISNRLIDENSEIRDKLIQMLQKWYQRSGYKKEKIIVETNSIKIKDNSVSICNEETEDDKWYEWDPDVLEVWEKSKKDKKWELEVFVKNENGKFILLEKGFLEFLLEKGFSSREPLKVVFQGSGKDGYIFSAGTGNHYRIPQEVIEEESLKNLKQRILQYEDEKKTYPRGLYLNVRIDTNTQGKIPQLNIVDFDTKNLDYMGLFYDSEYIKLEEPDKRQIEKNGFVVNAVTKNPERDMVVGEDGWGACAQRCGKVKLKAIEKERLVIYGSDAYIKQRIQYLYELYKSEEERFLEVRLQHRGKVGEQLSNKLLRGLTKEQMPVKIEADSIVFGNYKYPMIEFAPCIVRPASGINERMDVENKSKGIIWEISKVTAAGNRLIKVKYIYLDKVCEAQVESSNLEKTLNIDTIYVGMPVIYDNATNAMFPIFYTQKESRNTWHDGMSGFNQRMYHSNNKLQFAVQYEVRYLWKMEKRAVDYVEKVQNNGRCVDLGTHCIGDEEDIFHLTQDFESGKIYAVKKSDASQEELDESVLKAEVTIYGEQDALIDVHHLIEADEKFEDTSGSTSIPNQSQRLAKLYYDQYMDWRHSRLWLNNDCLHAEGIIVEERGNRLFEVRDPLKYLPCDGNDVSEEDAGKWTKRIKLRDEGEHLVDSSKLAYAKIELSEDGSFRADVDNAEPFSWEQFQKLLRKKYKNKNVYDIPLFYKDAKNGDMHFEWGIGRHFIIPESSLKVVGRGKYAAIQWFYGDKISSFRIEGKGREASLIIEIENYDFSIEHRIKSDAEKDIIQYVKVWFDKKSDRVIAEESTVSKPRLSNEDHAWSFEKVKAAGLKNDVIQKVKKSMPNGGRGCILVMLDRRKSKKRLVFGLADLKSLDSFVICLKGGEICQEGNDYYVTFSSEFSNCTMIDPDSELSINVYRRSFSYNESTLRVYFGKDKYIFQLKYMFVKVHNKNGKYQGDLKNLPWRPQSIVRDWLKRCGVQNVVVGKKHKSSNLMQVEIKPGIFCGAEYCEEINEGVTGRLYLRGESVFVEAISCSDDYFLTEGRIVELLMLDSAFGGSRKTEQFTVAGMPQIKLGNQELAEKLKDKRPPRYGKISKGSLIAAGNVNFGLLKVETEEVSGKEKIIFERYCKEQADVHFSRITFFDEGISEIRKHIKRGQWHYHDRFTRVNGFRKPILYKENSDLPVIFDDRWGMRFKEDELEKYVYPPHELEEFGLPEEQYGLDCRYPIAGMGKKGILVELSPGRIVEIPDSLLYIVDGNMSIGRLCTKYISKGDIVKLSTSVPEPGKPIQIRLTDIEYGLRSLIRENAFLPIISSEKGYMVMGGGFFQLKYPEMSTRKEDLCILDGNDNRVKYNKTQPRPKDLVFLELNCKNEIEVIGFPSLSVHISKVETNQKKVKNTDFLMKAFSYEDGKKKIFEIMQNRIPMVVDKVVDHEIYVYYPNPPLPEENTILCCQVIGALSKYIVCFRSGVLLFIIDIRQEINMPSEELVAEIVSRLKPGEKIWIHFANSTFKIGCYKSKYHVGNDNKRKVTIEEVIDCVEEHGFLCKDVLSREFYWMPVENVCRAEHATAKEVSEILFSGTKSRKQIFIEIDHQGYASYLKNNRSLSVPFDDLREDGRDKFIKVVVCSKIENFESYMNWYLCYERPKGNIYLLQAELEHKQDEKLDAYCVMKKENTAVLMPCNEIRTSIHLSPQLIKAVQQSYHSTEEQKNPELLKDDLKVLLMQYSEKSKEFGDSLLCFSRKLIGLKEYGDTDSSLIKCKAEIPEVINRYSNQLAFNKNDVTYMSLRSAVFVSAIAITANENVWKEIGKNIYDKIRNNIRYYCCEEILLEKWFLLYDYGSLDLRTLLNSAYLGGVELKEDGKDGRRTDKKNGSLTVNQVEKIKNVCETILRRNRDNESDDVVKLALCLLEVSGQMKNYPQYSNELEEAIEQTKCYELLGREENLDDAVKSILNLPEDDVFHSIYAHDPFDILRVINQSIK